MSQGRQHFHNLHAGYDLLPPEKRERQQPYSQMRPDVTDAEFVVIEKNVARARDNDNGAIRHGPAGLAGPMALTIAIGLARLTGHALDQLSKRSFAALTAGVVLAVFWLAGGLSALLPDGEASKGATAALAFRSVSGRIENANGLSVLVVTGAVENTSGIERQIPEIKLSLARGRDVLHSARIASPAGLLAPGKTAAFTVRLNHAGGKLPEIRLSFADPAGISGPL